MPRPSRLRAQFDTTISPIGHLQSTVKQECCAILCVVVRSCALLLKIKRREFITSLGSAATEPVPFCASVRTILESEVVGSANCCRPGDTGPDYSGNPALRMASAYLDISSGR